MHTREAEKDSRWSDLFDKQDLHLLANRAGGPACSPTQALPSRSQRPAGPWPRGLGVGAPRMRPWSSTGCRGGGVMGPLAPGSPQGESGNRDSCRPAWLSWLGTGWLGDRTEGQRSCG